MNKAIYKLIGGLALLLTGVGLVIASLLQQGEPTCDNQVMKPDDLCIVGGKAVTYEQRKAEVGGPDKTRLYIGVGVILLSGVPLLLSVRDRRRAVPVSPTPAE